MALFSALWMFVASSGVVVDIHYCQGKVKHISFFGKAKNCMDDNSVCEMHTGSCPMESESMHCSKKGECDKNCCHNEKKHIKISTKYDFQKPGILKTLDFAVAQSNYMLKLNGITYIFLPNQTDCNRPPPWSEKAQAFLQRFIC